MTAPSMATGDLWDAALGRLSSKVSPQNYDMWLRPIECVGPSTARSSGCGRRTATSGCGSSRTSSTPCSTRSATRPPACPPGRVRAEVDEPSRTRRRRRRSRRPARPSRGRAAAPIPRLPPSRAPRPGAAHEDVCPPPRPRTLNPRYTFETFVAGPSNQLAFAASQAAASSYPPKYNPVFICGGVGLGKTHLLHAIGHQQLAQPSRRAHRLPLERAVHERVRQRDPHRQDARVPRNYREGIDVLLVDDVQFLAGKESTQDEFFHTFNALHENHKQIVLTADRKPHEISRHRRPPALALRVGPARRHRAARARGPHRDPAQEGRRRGHPAPRRRRALHRSRRSSRNVRELEGALIRLAAYASLSKRRIDLEFAQETLGARSRAPASIITVDSVIKAVASYYGLKPSDIKSERRHKSVADAARRRDVPGAPPHQGQLPRPRASVRRQAPHDRHLGGPEDHRAAQGRRLVCAREIHAIEASLLSLSDRRTAMLGLWTSL